MKVKMELREGKPQLCIVAEDDVEGIALDSWFDKYTLSGDNETPKAFLVIAHTEVNV